MNNINKTVERLPLTNDYVFKRVFAKEGNENILKDLLEAVLDIKIEKVEVQNPEIPKEAIEDKLSVLDIKAQLDEKTIVDIEMQMTNEHNIKYRSLVYLSKNVSGQLQIGKEYAELKKSIVINFLNFEYYRRNSYHQVARMKFEKTREDEYVEMHFIELPKFKKKNPGVENKIEQWLWTIIGEEEKIEMAEKDNKEIKKAIEIVDTMSMDKRERELYEARLKGEFNYSISINVAKNEGREEGEQIGKKKTQKEIVKKMLSKKMPIEEIIEITGLTRKQIENINIE